MAVSGSIDAACLCLEGFRSAKIFCVEKSGCERWSVRFAKLSGQGDDRTFVEFRREAFERDNLFVNIYRFHVCLIL